MVLNINLNRASETFLRKTLARFAKTGNEEEDILEFPGGLVVRT